MPGSGKTTITKNLQEKNYTLIKMGDVIRNLAKEKGLKTEPKTIGKLAKEIRMEKGVTAIAELCLENIRKRGKQKIVIDGIRSLKEVKKFREYYPSELIAVYASPKKRFERLIKRNRRDDPKNWSQFVERDERELNFGIGRAIALAEYTIINEYSIKELEKSFIDMFERMNL
jgi:dephospho-CoA kinase